MFRVIPHRTMAPKRARTAAVRASASSSSQSAGATKLTLHGGVPHHPALAGLWRDEQLTDVTLSSEGVEFRAHRVALASSSEYFLTRFKSGFGTRLQCVSLRLRLCFECCTCACELSRG